MKINPKTKLFTELKKADKLRLKRIATKLMTELDVSREDYALVNEWFETCYPDEGNAVYVAYGSILPAKCLESIMESTCKWTEDSDGMMSGCGQLFPYDGGLPTDCKFCPYCGSKVKLPAAYQNLD